MAKAKDNKDYEGYDELDGDPVYDHIKSEVQAGGVLVGAFIEHVGMRSPKQPSKIIHVAVYNTEDKVVEKYTLNYNKIARSLNKE